MKNNLMRSKKLKTVDYLPVSPQFYGIGKGAMNEDLDLLHRGSYNASTDRIQDSEKSQLHWPIKRSQFANANFKQLRPDSPINYNKLFAELYLHSKSASTAKLNEKKEKIKQYMKSTVNPLRTKMMRNQRVVPSPEIPTLYRLPSVSSAKVEFSISSRTGSYHKAIPITLMQRTTTNLINSMVMKQSGLLKESLLASESTKNPELDSNSSGLLSGFQSDKKLPVLDHILKSRLDKIKTLQRTRRYYK